jgi:rhamnose utilization protein RhaD (predicted bifunctional aldolase and dehydrogenase)/NAD(P)-dependent dehydrogenase (short-subunit alcohol dehydrogenase family)
MQSRWSEKEAQSFCARYGERWGDDLALRTYSSRLIGRESSLVLHGGGNTSVKSTATNPFGEPLEAIFVKASGWDLAGIEPEGHCGLDLAYLQRARRLEELGDAEMVRLIRSRLLDYRSANPSIETLAHAFLPARFVDHTHADAILALTNQERGRELVEEALGDGVVIIDYVEPGFQLAKATAAAVEAWPDSWAAVWMRHGLITWGGSARESYERTVDAVTRAERLLERKGGRAVEIASAEVDRARRNWIRLAPVVRGALAEASANDDRPFLPGIVLPLIDEPTLGFLASGGAESLALTPPVTSDHLIRTKAYPLWISGLDASDPESARLRIREEVERYRKEYQSYFVRHAAELDAGVQSLDSSPRVILMPGVGAACAGPNLREAAICRDITAQTLKIKTWAGGLGDYRGLDEAQLFAMEYRGLQHAKLRASGQQPLEHHVALVTGAAGAIGAGICLRLLEEGCQVAASDLSADRLQMLMDELGPRFGDRIMSVVSDVTRPESVASAFDHVVSAWGGLDFVIVNAGVALVASLAEMKLEEFRRLERVNTEGTLIVLSESARFLEKQGIGGDIVLVSTKNVFAPGARFGAYSATKAASHQLARIASLELASSGVRVNMVAPDAVFGEGRFKSGLWAEVGPDRMRARGLSEDGLQDYYRGRNLLKARVTARHVGNAVLYFLTRQSPTTGATIPVDGGLPDSTPR